MLRWALLLVSSARILRDAVSNAPSAAGLAALAPAPSPTRPGFWASLFRRPRGPSELGGPSDLVELRRLLARQSERIKDLERHAPNEFEIMHYNLLADQYSSNLQPWFLYGADVTDAEREELHKRFYSKGRDGYKLEPRKGWPKWAEGVISKERQRVAEDYDERFFGWEARRDRLLGVLKQGRAHLGGPHYEPSDIITLAECDHYADFWRPRLADLGFESVWRKRPQDKSGDGCAIAWRNSTFELEAASGFDFGSSRESTKPDRTCTFALLKWRRDPTARVLVATTHLARGPELEEQRFARGYQYGKLFRELLEFAAKHDAENVPVVLTGDLNAQDCDELAGIARALVRLLSAPTHPLLWSVMDAPTPPTTYTDARSMRIDYVLYQSANLALTGVGRLPPVGEGMPNAMHPSDHLPVSCRLKIRQSWAVVEEDARQWAACIKGGSAVRPLSGEALRTAFTYFDKDGSGRVTLVQLEAGLQTLGFPGLDANRVLDALQTVGMVSGASSGGGGDVGWWTSGHLFDSRWSMSLDQFVEAYTQCMDRQTSASMRQIETAFKTFDISGDGIVTATELREALRRMSSAPLDEDRLELLIRELDPEETGKISMEAFTRWMNGAYSGFIKDPTRVVDGRAKMVQYSQ